MKLPCNHAHQILKLLVCSSILMAFSIPSSADVSSGVLATSLTFYKNGALIRQGQTLPLSTGKHMMHVLGIANSIIKESLMVSLSALPTEAAIDEIKFTKNEGEQNLTLDLLINSNVSEPKSYVNLTYLLSNMSWKPSYKIQFSPGYQQLMFTGGIEIQNTAGITFKNANIQFVDGNIPPIHGDNAEKLHAKAKGYTYKGMIDMQEKETKYLNLVTSSSIKTKQDYRIFVGGDYLKDMKSAPANPVIDTWVSFHNTAKDALGQDLPQGNVILYYQDEHGQFVLGNTNLHHTAVDQEISVRIPLTQIDKFEKNSKKETKRIETKLEQNQFRILNDTHMTEAQYCLTLENKGTDPMTIRVMLDLPAGITDCEFIRETVPHEKNGDNYIYWDITIKPNQREELKYHLRFITDAP